MADDAEDPVTLDSDIDEIAVAALDAGLVKFITDSDLSKRLVADALPNQPVKQALARYLLRLLAPIVAEKAKKGGEWLGGKALKRLGALIAKIPGVRGLLEAIKAKLDTLKTVDEAQEQFKEILLGRRPVHDHEDAKALTLDLQADLKLLSDLEGLSDQIEALRVEIADRLNPQPVLTVDFRDPSLEGGRFHYAAQRVPFIGRAQELERLGDFLYQPIAFCWWIVVGSGGMGKSRLALELILREANVWRAGFLARGADHDWQRWQPDRPTLIVVDYAYERPDALRRMIVALRRRTDLEMPVRVLVLEREAGGQWWDDFRASGGDGHAIAESRHNEPLALAAPPLEDQFRMIAETFAAAGRPLRDRADAEDIGGQVHDLDPQIRPLFVAFLADAMTRHGSDRRWDRTTLMDDVLRREYERWDALGADNSHHALLALATLCRTLKLEDVFNINNLVGIFPPLHTIDEALLADMAGKSPSDHISPLEPDLLGELFVLNTIERGFPNSRIRRKFLDLAWSLRAVEIGHTTALILSDFGEHPAIPHLTHRPTLNSLGILYTWAAWIIDFTSLLGGSRYPRLARQLYDAVRDISLAHPDYAELRVRQAQCAFNVVKCYSDVGEVQLAQELYDELRILASTYPLEYEIQLQQAKCVVNLTAAYSGKGEHEIAHDILSDLQQMTEKYHDIPKFRRALSDAIFNLMKANSNTGNMNAAQMYYDQLHTLTDMHKDEISLLLRESEAAVNLIYAYEKENDSESCIKLYKRLKASSAMFPREIGFKLHQAGGAVNLITALGKEYAVEDARHISNELKEIAKAHPEDAKLQHRYAMGLANLMLMFCALGDIASAHILHDELQTIAGNYNWPTSDETHHYIAETWFRGFANLIAAMHDHDKEKAEKINLAVQLDPHFGQIVLHFATDATQGISAEGQKDKAIPQRRTEPF